ncbi:MAG: hypothetical protein IKW58_01740 [Alphaproteobacteria bacterium]|nr:hypothetical protein [Alphaproteobacteria bacterium]
MENIWNKTKKNFSKAFNKTKDVSEEAWDKTVEFSEEAWDKTKNAFSKDKEDDHLFSKGDDDCSCRHHKN